MTTPEDEADKITLIDNRVEWSQLSKLHLTDTQAEALEANFNKPGIVLRSYGFTEVVAYVGCQGVMSMGGYWDSEEGGRFTVTSYGGNIESGTHIQTDGRGGLAAGGQAMMPWPKDDTPPEPAPCPPSTKREGWWWPVLRFILVVASGVAAGVYAGKSIVGAPVVCPECERRQAETMKVVDEMYQAVRKAIQDSTTATRTEARYIQTDTELQERQDRIDKARLEYEENIRKIEEKP